MKSRVTTKRGDRGETTTIAGDTLPKTHPILECCGELDCVRAKTARLRLQIAEAGPEGAEELADLLLWILHVYFLIGAQCNDPENKHPEYRKKDLGLEELSKLEAFQEGYEAQLTMPGEFIVSATTVLSAEFDVLCTETRRLERRLVALQESAPSFDAQHLLAFVNRLSDTFFVLARVLEGGDHRCVDYGVLGVD